MIAERRADFDNHHRYTPLSLANVLNGQRKTSPVFSGKQVDFQTPTQLTLHRDPANVAKLVGPEPWRDLGDLSAK
ncbi:hypothetical protein [Paracoccus sediminilitoris]|uniref:hypothetical protein n=1 Tax=Paracoccus sediminilitoris TaxID=2202419 RepID=UPI0011B9348E|nr:hypothetical protein [Paracoccus sediminilitoris]